MRNILLSLVMVAVLVAGGVGGTLADWRESDHGDYCWDAGYLNLVIDFDGVEVDLDYVGDLICENDIEPGDCGEETLSFHLKGAPASGHYGTLAVTGTLDDFENTCVEPEKTAGDTSQAAEDDGELDNVLGIKMWVDDGDNVWEWGECIIYCGTFADLVTCASSLDPIVIPLDICTDYYLGVKWVLPYYDTTYWGGPCTYGPFTEAQINQAMTDSLSGIVTFTAEGPFLKGTGPFPTYGL